MQATIQAKATTFSTARSERDTVVVATRTPSRMPQAAAGGAERPTLLKRFLAALVAALAVPTI
jgi:hypothetical protein